MALHIGNGVTISITPGGTEFVWTTLTSATTVVANQGYFLDYGVVPTAFDVTLPSSPLPAEGDVITFLHVRGDVDSMISYPKILHGGNNIDGALDDVDIDTNYDLFSFVYSGISSIGWRLV